MKIFNAEEVIHVDGICIKNDSIRIQTPVFEGYIKGKFTETTIEDAYVKESLERVVPFRAIYRETDSFTNSKQAANVPRIWEVNFNKNTPDSYMSKGIFTQIGDKEQGTFRTTTGRL